jgi:hypothetical protein
LLLYDYQIFRLYFAIWDNIFPLPRNRGILTKFGVQDCERLTQECGIPASYCAQYFTEFQRIREGIHQAFDHLAAFQQFAVRKFISIS